MINPASDDFLLRLRSEMDSLQNAESFVVPTEELACCNC